jgi:hypothetical protein
MAEIAWAWIQLKIFGKGALQHLVAGHLVELATLLWSRPRTAVAGGRSAYRRRADVSRASDHKLLPLCGAMSEGAMIQISEASYLNTGLETGPG